MQNQLPLACRAAFLLTASITFCLVGCKKEQAAAPSAPATAPAKSNPVAAGETAFTYEGVSFQYPAGWKVKQSDGVKGLEVVGPEDAGWEPNLYFVIHQAAEDVALDELLSQNMTLLAARKQNYVPRNNQQMDHPNGFKYGRIEYENTSEPGDVPLRQWSVIVPLANKKYLQIQAGSAAASWEKFQPTFEKVINSVKLPK